MKNLHFVHGFKDSTLGLCDRLAIASAWDHNPDYTVHLWAPKEPEGPHWDALVKRVPVKLMPIDDPVEWNGSMVPNYQHRADLIRHTVLYTMGGVYCDTDTLTLTKFPAAWEKHDTVIGIETCDGKQVGLCNAVMASRMHSKFQWHWLQKWQEFNGTGWNEISVLYPLQLAKQIPGLAHTVQFEMLGFMYQELERYWCNPPEPMKGCVIAHLWRTYVVERMQKLTEADILKRDTTYAYHAADHL